MLVSDFVLHSKKPTIWFGPYAVYSRGMSFNCTLRAWTTSVFVVMTNSKRNNLCILKTQHTIKDWPAYEKGRSGIAFLSFFLFLFSFFFLFFFPPSPLFHAHEESCDPPHTELHISIVSSLDCKHPQGKVGGTYTKSVVNTAKRLSKQWQQYHQKRHVMAFTHTSLMRLKDPGWPVYATLM